jgi:cytoskeletal protein CcmA (bactofilin family)
MADAPGSGNRTDPGIPADSSPQPILIESGTEFEGLVASRSGVRIEGEFEGEVAAKGRIELGELSQVTGIVEGDEIVIAGRFEGTLVARRKIEFLPTAIVHGDFAASELVAEDGCTVRGKCRTGPFTA